MFRRTLINVRNTESDVGRTLLCSLEHKNYYRRALSKTRERVSLHYVEGGHPNFGQFEVNFEQTYEVEDCRPNASYYWKDLDLFHVTKVVHMRIYWTVDGFFYVETIFWERQKNEKNDNAMDMWGWLSENNVRTSTFYLKDMHNWIIYILSRVVSVAATTSNSVVGNAVIDCFFPPTNIIDSLQEI